MTTGALVAAAVGAVLLVLLAVALARRPSPRAPVYLDLGTGSRVFESRRHGIRAKPDKLEHVDGGRRRHGTVELVEYKSRPRARLYPSDTAQIIATALAVREAGLDVRRARLETGGGAIPIDLDVSDEALHERIRPAVEAARLVAAGGMPTAAPAAAKCRGCGWRERCPHAV